MKITIVETPEFISQAKKVLDEEEKRELIDYLADYPKAGDLIEGTGGARKLRWSRKGVGKRGGSRVIYFFYNDSIPLFLLTVYAKNKKVDLSEKEKSEMKSIFRDLVKNYREGGE